MYQTHREAEQSVKELHRVGMDMPQPVFWGFLFGSAFFIIPGVGPRLVAGLLVSWIVGALEGAALTGGLSALGAGLYSIGIPKNSVLDYETAVKSWKFVLIVHGTAAEVAKAKEVLDATRFA